MLNNYRRPIIVAFGRTLLVAGLLLLGWSLWFAVFDLAPAYREAAGQDSLVGFSLGLFFLVYFALPVAAILVTTGLLVDAPRSLRNFSHPWRKVLGVMCVAGAAGAVSSVVLNAATGNPIEAIVLGLPQFILAVLFLLAASKLLEFQRRVPS